MINIVFFAQIREILGSDGIELNEQQSENISTVDDLVSILAKQFKNWDLVVSNGPCLCAVNQTIVPFSHEVNDGDEVAFFPPVTGG